MVLGTVEVASGAKKDGRDRKYQSTSVVAYCLAISTLCSDSKQKTVSQQSFFRCLRPRTCLDPTRRLAQFDSEFGGRRRHIYTVVSRAIDRGGLVQFPPAWGPLALAVDDCRAGSNRRAASGQRTARQRMPTGCYTGYSTYSGKKRQRTFVLFSRRNWRAYLSMCVLPLAISTCPRRVG